MHLPSFHLIHIIVSKEHYLYKCPKDDTDTIYCYICVKALKILLDDQFHRCEYCWQIVIPESVIQRTPKSNIPQKNENHVKIDPHIIRMLNSRALLNNSDTNNHSLNHSFEPQQVNFNIGAKLSQSSINTVDDHNHSQQYNNTQTSGFILNPHSNNFNSSRNKAYSPFSSPHKKILKPKETGSFILNNSRDNRFNNTLSPNIRTPDNSNQKRMNTTNENHLNLSSLLKSNNNTINTIKFNKNEDELPYELNSKLLLGTDSEFKQNNLESSYRRSKSPVNPFHMNSNRMSQLEIENGRKENMSIKLSHILKGDNSRTPRIEQHQGTNIFKY